MGFIKQTQRSAIEKVFTEERLVLRDNLTYFVDGEEFCLLGISEGVGTCSEMEFHGINVAVLISAQQYEPSESVNRKIVFPVVCRGGAVIWRRREENEPNEFPHTEVCNVVEGLVFESQDGGRMTFTRNGRKKMYVPL